MESRLAPAPSSDSDSLDPFPQRMLVGEATREWSLRVDEKLAHRLQEEEISKHLDGNRHRNDMIRQSYPVAASLQQMALDEANRKASVVQQRLEHDARLAKEQQKLEIQKAGIKLNKDNKLKRGTSHPPTNGALPEEYEASPSTSQAVPGHSGNGAIPRRPVPPRSGKAHSADMNHSGPYREEHSDGRDNNANLAELELALGISKEQLNMEKERLLQEEKDAELARQLLNCEIRDPVEITDGELARRLQDREYERYQRNKEKRALRKQMEKMRTGRSVSQQQDDAPELNDTYSQPHDSLPNSSVPVDHSANNRLILSQSSTNNSRNSDPMEQEDPYYMEPIHVSDPPFMDHLNIQNNNNNDIGPTSKNGNYLPPSYGVPPVPGNINGGRSYMMTNSSLHSTDSGNSSMEHRRAPPAPPKTHGRPRMAEPGLMGSLRSNEDKDRSKARCRQM